MQLRASEIFEVQGWGGKFTWVCKQKNPQNKENQVS